MHLYIHAREKLHKWGAYIESGNLDTHPQRGITVETVTFESELCSKAQNLQAHYIKYLGEKLYKWDNNDI